MRVIMQWGDGRERSAEAKYINKETETVSFAFDDQLGQVYFFQNVGDFWFEVDRPHEPVHIQPYKESSNGDL